jgi:hypothetical protein
MDRGGDINHAGVLRLGSLPGSLNDYSRRQSEVDDHAGLVDRRLQYLQLSSRSSEVVVQIYHLGPRAGAPY